MIRKDDKKLKYFDLGSLFCTYYMRLCVSNPTIWVPTRSTTNQAVQSHKKVRSLKFQIQDEEELYYPCGENKGADQLSCAASLFSPMQIVGFFHNTAHM